MGRWYVAAAYLLMLVEFWAAAFGSNSIIPAGNSTSRENEAEACVQINNITLSLDLYVNSCPEAEAIVFSWVEKAVADDPRMAASLLRLHFHDCFVDGCDASVLLDDTGSMVGEKSAAPNANSLRGFQLIDAIKAEIEYFCPQTVSCADILAIAARDSVVLSGGPGWDVEMGRKDSSAMARQAAANSNIPSPNSDLPTLVSKFQNVGLSLQDLVALSGAHTIGKARCSTFAARLNEGDTMMMTNPAFLESLQQLCATNDINTTLAELDHVTPTTFDNTYFINLVEGEALLASDQALLHDQAPRRIVQSYAQHLHLFFQDFANSMLAMGRLQNGSGGGGGQIRRSCRAIN